MPDGSRLHPWYDAGALPELLRHTQQKVLAAQRDTLAHIGSWHEPDARSLWPRWAGERFDLGEAVRVLFNLTLPGIPTADHPAADDVAA